MKHILVLDRSGKIIYSKCFGGFCDTLLDGEQAQFEKFVEGIARAPQIFGTPENNVLKYQVNTLTLRMVPVLQDYIVVMTSDASMSNEVAERVLASVRGLLEHLSPEELGEVDKTTEFTKGLAGIQKHLLHFETDPCDKENCPLETSGLHSPLWEELRERHNLTMERTT